jgi:hypothetical protein
MLFATTLNVSLRWLKGRWVLAALLGGSAGPLSFYAGHRLGGVAFADPVYSLTVLGLGWAVLMPLLLWLGGRLDGLGHTNTVLAGRSCGPTQIRPDESGRYSEFLNPVKETS